MLNSTSTYIRRPKGKLAMFTLYGFTGSAIAASIIFSLLLFLSIHDKLLMQILFGSLAVIFELGKFFAWYELGERMARRAFRAAVTAFGFYLVLAAISIGGSIGGINSATNVAQQHVDQSRNRVDAYNEQIAAIDAEIALNNKAADKYLELEMISIGVARIQKQNQALRKQQSELRILRDNLPVTAQGSVISLISSLAKLLNTSNENAQSWLVVFLSILLDIFAAFFVGLIGEELRFLHSRKGTNTALKNNAGYEQSSSAVTDDGATDQVAEQMLSQRARDILQSAQTMSLKCSKKLIAETLHLTDDEVDKAFLEFLNLGLVEKKRNNHLKWRELETVA